MSKSIYLLFFCFFYFIVFSCKEEVILDENEAINKHLKNGVYEYLVLTYNANIKMVVTVRKFVKGDTVEFIICARSSIALFEQDKVFYCAKYLKTYIFTNYRNTFFKDSCGLCKAIKYLDEDEYKYFIEKRKVPPPSILLDVPEMRMIFVDNKLIKQRID